MVDRKQYGYYNTSVKENQQRVQELEVHSMKKRYIITGANGHLGSTLIRMLAPLKEEIYGLILPNDSCPDTDSVHYIKGDVRDISSLCPLFEGAEKQEIYVIHTAGIIDISEKGSPMIYDVNINGTKNMLRLSKEYGVKRFLYVSSVHAIPEKDHFSVISETDQFSPDAVIGVYAQTKAVATQAVLDAGRQGLDVVVVHPSGIIGPNDPSGNHLVQMITDYLRGALPACVKGGYDFVDVRDVAMGCLQALNKGASGGCYILSNRHYEIRDVLHMARTEGCGRKLVVMPMWMAKAFAPAMQWYAKLKKCRPLYTKYSLYTLKSNDRFSHDKATLELGYLPRDLRETIRDTVAWYKSLRNRKTDPYI